MFGTVGAALCALAAVAPAAGLRAPPAPGPEVSDATPYSISWFRPCECTGMEIEALGYLKGLVDLLGPSRVRTNKCQRTCSWARELLNKTQVEDDVFRSRTPLGRGVQVYVAHDQNACGVPPVMSWIKDTPWDHGILRVRRSMSETDQLDHRVAADCNRNFDAVWVPSDFNLQAFSRAGVSAAGLRVLREAVDPKYYNCSRGVVKRDGAPFDSGNPTLDKFFTRAREGPSFTFFSVFKWEARKNWEELLESFARAFPQKLTELPGQDGQPVNTTVRLLIKTDHYQDNFLQEMQALVRRSPVAMQNVYNSRVTIVSHRLEEAAMARLYHAVDAFVLPSHGEGWGLPLAEAMASGLPTISTDWGGQTEYMNRKNSFLVGHRIDLAKPAVGQKQGPRWAVPLMEELKQAMLDVARRPDEARARATQACADMSRLTPAAMAQRVDELVLDRLRSLHMRTG